jgi:hypothetical protein
VSEQRFVTWPFVQNAHALPDRQPNAPPALAATELLRSSVTSRCPITGRLLVHE